LEGKGGFPALSISDEVVISSITRLELLSGLLAEDAEAQVKVFLSQVREHPSVSEVIDQAIVMRKAKRLHVPDAIIVATALIERAVLVTADKELSKKADEIKCHDPLA
jgi:hypothetical protein